MVYFLVEGPFDVNSVCVYMSGIVCGCLPICVLIAHLKVGLSSTLDAVKTVLHRAIATGCVTAHTTANEWDS